MNDRRRALVGKFRASAIDRLRRLLRWLEETEESGIIPRERQQELKRDLHTLKGESTMLGFAAVSEVFHAAEGRLGSALSGGPEELREAAKKLAVACHVVIRSLQEPELDVVALAAARDVLAAARPGAPHADEPVASAPTIEVKEDKPSAPERWVQVQARRVDDLCERASDFEMGFRALHYRLREIIVSRRNVEAGVRAMLPELDRARVALEEVTGAAWSLRLVSVEPTLAELVSHAKEIAESQSKKMRVSVRSGDAQIERTVLDAIWEPLVHLVRNAVDHGIEPTQERGEKGEATLLLEAEAVGTNILFSIADDGRGIDVARLRASAVARGVLSEEASAHTTDAEVFDLIFVHGFSTRTTVSDLSGRGIGLDVVRSSVEGVGGAVHVSSEVGKGTRFTLSVPASISKERALVFGVGDALYALPSRTVASVIKLSDEEVSSAEDGKALRLGDEMLPLRSMAAALAQDDHVDEAWASIVEVASRHFAFSMGRPLGEIALLRRPIDKLLSASGAVNGSAILEDGRIVLMLASAGLVRQSERHGFAQQAPPAASLRTLRVLVVDDSAVVRDLMAQVLEHAGFEVAVASGGREALAEFSVRRSDAVLLDVDMPDMDGFETLQRFRERDARVPVLMLSMRASAADKHRATALGASAYFVKSQFQETTIVDALRRFVEAS